MGNKAKHLPLNYYRIWRRKVIGRLLKQGRVHEIREDAYTPTDKVYRAVSLQDADRKARYVERGDFMMMFDA